MAGQAPKPDANDPPQSGQMLIYEDGALNLRVRLDGQTVWLTQKQLADLYQVTVPNVNQHLQAIYSEGELAQNATAKQYLIVQTEGKREIRRLVEHYSLDVILAIGYRVRSARGTQFRQGGAVMAARCGTIVRCKSRRMATLAASVVLVAAACSQAPSPEGDARQGVEPMPIATTPHAVTLPPIDSAVPKTLETATFALG